MTHYQIQLFYTLSLTIWLPFSLLVLGYCTYLGMKKIRQRSLINKSVSISLAFFYSLPSLILFIIMMVPFFYVMNLSKQENYCLDIVQFNKLTQPNHSFLQERCSNFDLNELIERAYQ